MLAGETLAPVPALSELEGRETALRSNEYKLIQSTERAFGYRLAQDPAEMAPHVPHQKDRQRMAELVAEAEAFRGRIGSRATRRGRAELDLEVRERLRSLGYIVEGEADANP